MVEFEAANGDRVLVNPDHVKVVECVKDMIGTFRLVLEFFPMNTAKGMTVGSHAVTVKNETFSEIVRKLNGETPLVVMN